MVLVCFVVADVNAVPACAVWLFPVSAVALVVVMGSAVQCCVAVLVVLG